ncbi:MAG: cation:proton antiporter [Candidatus Wildermuthbacteria bacterium]|nr:cation:proton antiporter [Candidatus Wildermuthbacteria bacterium]
MTEFIAFFVVLAAGLIVSEIFGRLHLPLVVALIVGGILIGPYGLEWFIPNPTIEFFGQIGLVFLMFMAGLEIKLSSFREFKGDVAKISLLNGLVPLGAGIGLGIWFGLDWIAVFFLGIIFLSSSVAVISPSLQANALLSIRLGRIVISSAILHDVTSLFLLLILLRFLEPNGSAIPDYLFYPLFVLSLFGIRWLIPRVHAIFISGAHEKDLFEEEVRIVLVALIGTVVFFELMGLHAIIAGFFTGLVFSEIIKSNILKEKLRTISYGLFVPIFFIVVGTQTNIRVFTEINGTILLTILIVGGSVFSKFVSGWVGGKLIGFTNREAVIVGVATVPQLSTALAVVAVGYQRGLLSQELVAAIVVLSVTGVFLAPLLISFLSKKSKEVIAVSPRAQEKTEMV